MLGKLAKFISWWNAEPALNRNRYEAYRAAPRDHLSTKERYFAALATRFDENGRYIFNDPTLGGVSEIAAASRATMAVFPTFTDIANIGYVYRTAVGNGVMVTVDSSVNVATSTDGINFTNQTTAPALFAVAFGAGLFVGIVNATGNSIYTSTDGATWTQNTSVNFTSTNQGPQAVQYAGGFWISTGGGLNLRSSDGLTWANASAQGIATQQVYSATDGTTIAYSVGTQIGYSTDYGNSWSVVTSPTGLLSYMAYGGGYWYIINYSTTTNRYLYTATSITGTWTSVTYYKSVNIGTAGPYLFLSSGATTTVYAYSGATLAYTITMPSSQHWSGAGQIGSMLVLAPGAYATLPSAPSAPTLTAPANASSQNAAASITFTATYNATDGETQNAYAMRVKTSVGSYQYWNAGTTSLQGTIVWNTDSVAVGGSWSITLPANTLSPGTIYDWSMASQESGANLQGPFASDFTFTTPALSSGFFAFMGG